MKAHRVFFVLATVALGALTVTGCGGDETEPANNGGGGGAATTTTTSAGGAGGTSTTTGTGTGTGSSTTTTTNPPAAVLAASCYDDSECGEGLRCATPEAIDPAFGGAVQNGYCTKDCAKDADCPGGGLCLQLVENGAKQCVAACIPGGDYADGFDEAKCSARQDLTCQSVTSTKTGCMPRCSDECEGDYECDPRSGLCVDPANIAAGLADGAKCDPEAAVPECSGVCLQFGPDADAPTACSTPCTLYGDYNVQCGGLSKGFCAFAQEGAGPGDLGFCSAACKKQDDCQNPTFWCADIGAPSNGYCFGADTCETNADCPPQDDGNGGKKQVDECIETKYGKLCLNPKYDLGSAAPGTGGGGAGGTGGAGGAATTTTGTGGAGGASTTTTTTGTGGSGGSSTTTTTTTGTGGAGGSSTTTTTGTGGGGGGTGGGGGSAGAGGITTST